MNDHADFPGLQAAMADDRFVRAVARRVVRDAAAADDIAQDAWMAALERRPEARPSLRGWLSTVVVRLAQNRRRGEGRRERREADAAKSEAVAPEVLLLEREELRRKLVAAVVALGRPQSTVIVLRYFEDLPPRTIASNLGLPVETVRTHLKRGIARLREHLSAERQGGRSLLAVLPLLLPRHDFAAALAGAALVTVKAKVSLAVVLTVAVCGGYVAFRSDDRPEGPTPPPAVRIVPGHATEAPPPIEQKSPESAPITSTPFQEPAAAASNPVRPAGTCVVRVLVRDMTGAAVPDCAVLAVNSGPDGRFKASWIVDLLAQPEREAQFFSQAESRGLRRTKTDVDGRAVLDALDVTEHGMVAAYSRTLGVAVREGVSFRDGDPLELTLTFKPAVVVFGRVTDENDAPIAGEDVTFFGEREDGTSTHDVSAKTDAKGEYRTIPLTRRSFQGQVQRDGYKFASARTGTIKPEDRELRMDFKLERAPILRGRLVRAGGAKAGLGAAIAERGLSRSEGNAGVYGSHDDPRTAANFLDIGRDEGKVDLAADAWTLTPMGGVPKYVSLWVGRSIVAAAETNGATDVDLVVDLDRLPRPLPRGKLVIRPVDDDGKPVTADVINLDQRFQTARAFDRMGFLPDGAGGFFVDGLPVSTYVIEVGAPGFCPRTVEADLLPLPATTEVRVVLRKPTSSLAVRAKFSDGKPASAAKVYLLDESLRPAPRRFHAELNAEGRAVFEGLAPGDYVVCVKPDREDLPPASARVRVDGARSETEIEIPVGVEITVDPEGTSGPFSFRYLREDGTPLYDAAAFGSRSYFDVTKDYLPPVRLTLEIRCPDFEPAIVTFVPAEGLVVKVPMQKLPGG